MKAQPSKVPKKRFSGYGETFLTEMDIAVMDTALRTNSVKATCEMLHISTPRYYQITGNIVRKWGMSFATNNKIMGFYTKARNQKNILARHLTVVKRLVPIEGTAAAPAQAKEIEESVPPPGESVEHSG